MQYLIGQLLKEYIQKNDLTPRHLAIQADINQSAICHVVNENRTAREAFLSKIMDVETLKEPLKDYIKQNIDTLDTATIIDMYNAIYNNAKD